MSQITIYHNPECGTSRNTLELIRNSGEEPTVMGATIRLSWLARASTSI